MTPGHHLRRFAPALVGCALGLGAAFAPSTAHAQEVLSRFILRGELGAGAMLSSYQQGAAVDQHVNVFGGKSPVPQPHSSPFQLPEFHATPLSVTSWICIAASLDGDCSAHDHSCAKIIAAANT